MGGGALAKNIANEILENKDCGYKISGIVEGKNKICTDTMNVSSTICRTGYDDLCEQARNLNIDKIIVALEERRMVFPIQQLLQCRVNGIDVLEGTSFYEMLTGKLIVEKINPSWLIFSEGFRKSWLRRKLKRSCGPCAFLDFACRPLPATPVGCRVDQDGFQGTGVLYPGTRRCKSETVYGL